jgi:hypothetical protein
MSIEENKNLIRRMKGGIGALLASLALAAGVLLTPAIAAAAGGLGPPTSVTQLGTFGKIAYVQYDGIFEGQTSTGTYRVPYRITAPADPKRANRTVLVEPPHYFGGLLGLDVWLGRDFLLSRGFVHAGVGYSTASPEGGNMRILDPNVPGVFINGGVIIDDGSGVPENGRTDDEIIADFARALVVDANAQAMIGRVDRRYLTGVSDSSAPVDRLITSGRAAGVFDFALPYTTAGDLQAALPGLYSGKLIVVNSELEGTSAGLVDIGVAPGQYRFYAVAGAPHIPDSLMPPAVNPGSKTTPASYQPELRAHFLQGDSWVQKGKAPPPSNHLKTSDGVTLDRDMNGNALSVDANGNAVPRLPIVELGEAHYVVPSAVDFLLGSYDNVKKIADLGLKDNKPAYRQAFDKALKDYLKAGYILKEDADAMSSRAALCPGQTFTETYRDHYDAFTTIGPTCSP